LHCVEYDGLQKVRSLKHCLNFKLQSTPMQQNGCLTTC